MERAQWVAGVDEVGRGPLAGPVVAAVVVLPPDHGIAGLRDSKKLSAGQRQRLDALIRARAWAYALGRAEVEEIDEYNIHGATLLAMARAVHALPRPPDTVLVDGLHLPPLALPMEAIVGGDARVPVIAAASIIAKVARDAEMEALDRRYPGYGLAQHKGYPTAAHLAALRRLGVASIHRRSYAPVRRLLTVSAG